MTFRAYDWALKQQDVRSVTKNVLTRLSLQANEYGICFPSQKALSENLGYEIRSIKRAIGELAEKGYLSVYVRRDKNKKLKNTYVVLFPGNASLADLFDERPEELILAQNTRIRRGRT